MNFFYILLITGGCAFISNAQYSSDTVTAVKGEPVILNFKYRGFRVDRVYTKDGNIFKADRQRTFQRFGKIYFSKVLLSDSGTYRLVVGEFNEKITLNGKLLKQHVSNAMYLIQRKLIILYYFIKQFDATSSHVGLAIKPL